MKRGLLAALLLSSMVTLVQAQDQYPPDKVFKYYDRNRNGKLDYEDYGRMQDSFKQAIRAARLDLRKGVDYQTFLRAWPRMQGEMRAQRDRDASRGDSRSSDYRRDDSRPQPRKTEKPKTKRPPKRKPQPRLTIDLPTKFSEVDKNRDGQIGLYEWDRAKFKEFFAHDQNNDGFLTPRELTAGNPVAASPRTTLAATSRTSSTPSSSSKPAEAPKAGSGTITPVKFDPESSDGRRASYVFRSLDRDKDGTLTEEEWERSQSTRRDFERKNVKPPLPAKLEQFAGLYIAVRKAR
ncbi:MAG: hypothetical protein H8E37_01085 [Planctomycetes bacterium]|nr:hypothetical protein [Planctomycetota bacterium]